MLPEDNNQQPVQPAQPPVAPPVNPAPVASDPVQSSFGSPKKPNTKLIISLIAAGVILIALIVTGVVYALNNNSTKNDDKSAVIEQDEDKTPDPVDESVDVIETEVGKTITDPEMGFTIKVDKIRVNVPLDKDLTGLSKVKKGVAVQVTATNNTQYSTRFYSTNLKLVTNGTTDFSSATAFDEYVESENLTKFPSSGVSRDNTTTAWVFFYTDKDNEDLTLRYERRETRIIGGSGGTIPAKNFDVKL